MFRTLTVLLALFLAQVAWSDDPKPEEIENAKKKLGVENSTEDRLAAMKMLRKNWRFLGEKEAVSIFEKLLKEDKLPPVRVKAISCWAAIFIDKKEKIFPLAILKYLDDPDEEIQEQVCHLLVVLPKVPEESLGLLLKHATSKNFTVRQEMLLVLAANFPKEERVLLLLKMARSDRVPTISANAHLSLLRIQRNIEDYLLYALDMGKSHWSEAFGFKRSDAGDPEGNIFRLSLNITPTLLNHAEISPVEFFDAIKKCLAHSDAEIRGSCCDLVLVLMEARKRIELADPPDGYFERLLSWMDINEITRKPDDKPIPKYQDRLVAFVKSVKSKEFQKFLEDRLAKEQDKEIRKKLEALKAKVTQ